MMENTRIGLNAGKVWRELGLTFEEVAVAIGWLARENKISFREKDNMLFVKIDDVEFSFG